jgi:dethiobiotin synthase
MSNGFSPRWSARIARSPEFGMPRVVLLGTGTSVGKTYVGRALAAALSGADVGAVIGALKPVESGLVEPSSDARLLAEASTPVGPAVPPPLYGYAEPLTPYLAALRSARPSIDIGRILDWVTHWEEAVRRDTGAKRSWTLIETTGGVFSPLSESATNYDLALALEPCTWVLVAPDALGVLHDVTATLEALSARGRSPDYVVLSAARAPDSSTGTNAGVLEALRIVAPAAVLGRNDGALGSLAARLVTAEPK